MGNAMTSKIRRLVAAFLVPIVFASSVLYPAREARAFVPVIAPIAMSIYGVGGAIIASDAFAAVGTALLGGTAMAFILSIGGDNPVDLRIPVQSDQAKTDAAMPPPTTAASVPYVQGQASYTWNGQSFGSGAEACSAAGAWQLSSCAAANPVWVSGSGTYNATSGACDTTCCLASGGCNHFPATISGGGTSSTCPSGTTNNGSSCTVTNARLYQADSKVDYARSGSGYAAIPDADTAKGADSRQMVGNSLQAWGKDSNGNPTVVTVGVDANGNTTATVQRQMVSSGGQSVIRTDSYTVAGSSGAVQGASTTTAAGSIGFNAATGTPTITQGATVAPTEVPAINIPTDYNREATQQTIKDKTAISADKLTDISDKFKAGELSPVAPFDPSVFTPLKPNGGDISSWISTLLSKIGLPAGGQCSNASISSTLLGRSITLDFVAFCVALAPIINWFAWVLVVFGVWRAVHQVTTRSDSAFTGAK